MKKKKIESKSVTMSLFKSVIHQAFVLRFALPVLALLLLSMVLVCVQSCSADQDVSNYGIIAKDTEIATGLMHLQVREHPTFVEISGENPNSGLTISRVTVKKHKHELIMKVHFNLCGIPHPLTRKSNPGSSVTEGGLRGYKIELSPEIERIVAGKKKRVVIWERPNRTN